MTYYIYCITNKINDKSYVGRTVDLEKRWRDHVAYGTIKYNYKKKSFAIHSAIKKYGIDNFSWQVIEECQTVDESNESEEFLVSYLMTLAPNGYNLHPGGRNKKPSAETKKKISETLKKTGSFVGKKGALHPNFGKKYSQERKDHLSEIRSGNNGPNKKINDEVARQIYIDYMENVKLRTNDLIKKYGIKRGAILNILNKKCWKKATKDLPDVDVKSRTMGENWVKSTITEEIAINILKENINNGLNPMQISKKYNLPYGVVYGITTRKNWKHIKI